MFCKTCLEALVDNDQSSCPLCRRPQFSNSKSKSICVQLWRVTVTSIDVAIVFDSLCLGVLIGLTLKRRPIRSDLVHYWPEVFQLSFTRRILLKAVIVICGVVPRLDTALIGQYPNNEPNEDAPPLRLRALYSLTCCVYCITAMRAVEDFYMLLDHSTWVEDLVV